MLAEQDAQGLRVGDALLLEDAGGEGVWRVARQHRAAALEDYGAAVVLGVDEVDGAARLGVPGVDDGLVDVVPVHAGAAVAGEQGGMDIDNAARVGGGDVDELEVSREHSPGDSACLEALLQGFGGDAPFEYLDGDAPFAGPVSPEAFAGGDDEGDLGVEAGGVDLVEEVEQRAAAAGEEDRQAGWFRVVGWCRGHVVVRWRLLEELECAVAVGLDGEDLVEAGDLHHAEDVVAESEDDELPATGFAGFVEREQGAEPG